MQARVFRRAWSQSPHVAHALVVADDTDGRIVSATGLARESPLDRRDVSIVSTQHPGAPPGGGQPGRCHVRSDTIGGEIPVWSQTPEDSSTLLTSAQYRPRLGYQQDH